MRNGMSALTIKGVACSATFILIVGCLAESGWCQSEEVPESAAKKTVEPVFRVSKLVNSKSQANSSSSDVKNRPATGKPINRIARTDLPAAPSRMAEPENAANTIGNNSTGEVKAKRAPHPLDRAVEDAKLALTDMRNSVRGYTAIMAKREQVNGCVGAPSYMSVKIRCPRTDKSGHSVPFSIYMKFLRPKQFAGREVIWVDGQNEGKLVVHEAGGLIGLRRIYLDPTGWLAMKDQRYPIYEAGLENLMVKLIEKAERDREIGPCIVNYRDNAEINKRPCSVIELIHNDRDPKFEFHKAKVYIDQEYNLPVRYVAYDWPKAPGQKPGVMEEYTYYNIRLNPGLTDVDFSPENPAYKFPRR